MPNALYPASHSFSPQQPRIPTRSLGELILHLENKRLSPVGRLRALILFCEGTRDQIARTDADTARRVAVGALADIMARADHLLVNHFGETPFTSFVEAEDAC